MSDFCRYLSNQQRFVYGKIQPCCWFTRTADMSNKTEVEKYNQWLYKIDGWVPECSFCYHREKNNMHSPRLDSFQNTPSGYQAGDILTFEFQIDRDCNAACLICGTWNSTTWEKSTNELEEYRIDFDLQNKLNVAEYIKQIKSTVNFSHVSKLLFLGGEPLRSNTHLEIIKEVQKFRSLDQIRIEYTTNGSIVPSDEIIDLWKQFKRVTLSLSIDGIGEHFNYLRWPLKWHQVENNIRHLLDLNIPTVNFSCSYTITPFNIFYHDTYVDWAKKFFDGVDSKTVKLTRFFTNPFSAFGIMDTSSIPDSLQQEIREKYQLDVSGGHSVTKLLKSFNPTDYQNFMDYVDHHDQQRKTNWRDVFPEIQHHFK